MICNICGVEIADADTHAAWHRRQDDRISALSAALSSHSTMLSQVTGIIEAFERRMNVMEEAIDGGPEE